PGNTPDWYALDVLGYVLSSGASSRLYQKLVKEKEVALSAGADANEQRGTSLFWLSVMARPNTDMKPLEALLDDEIARLKKEPVADWELAKVRMQLRRQRAQQIYSNPGLINSVWNRYEQVTKADLQRVAQRYLSESNRTVVITLPKPAGPAEKLQ